LTKGVCHRCGIDRSTLVFETPVGDRGRWVTDARIDLCAVSQRRGTMTAGRAFLLPSPAAHYHIDPSATALAAHKLCRPIRNRRLSAVSLRHLARVRLDLMLAIPAPHDQSKVSPRRAAECGWRPWFGFQLSASPIPALRRRLVVLQWRRGLANGLGSDLGEDRA
jgi:hypothetical protein